MKREDFIKLGVSGAYSGAACASTPVGKPGAHFIFSTATMMFRASAAAGLCESSAMN